MLEAIRKRSGSIVVKVLLVFLIMSFGAWGVGDYINTGVGTGSVAKVGEVDITQYEFNNEMQREMNRLRGYFGGSLDAEMARNIGLPKQVLARMMRSALFLEVARDLGIVIDDELVTQEIRSIPAFNGLTGQFDKSAFLMTIANAGFSEQMYVRLVRDDLKRSSLVDSLNGGTVGSLYMSRLLNEYRNETRSMEYFKINDSRFGDAPTPSDVEISTYHNDNQDQFMAPEYRSVSYITFSASDFAEVSAVSEQEILDAYENRKASFVSLGRRQVLQSIYSDEATAIKAVDMINQGRDFAETANELTGAAADSLDLGWVTRDDMLSQDIADVLFATGIGETSQPVNSMLGWHVFKVIDAQEETIQEFAEVREGLREDVALENAIDTLFDQANKLDDELGSGATLEEAAQVLGLIVKRMDSVDRNAADRSGAIITDLPANNFVSTAFATPEGTDSALIETDDSAYFVLRVNSIDAPALRPVDTVRNSIIGAIKAKYRREQARIVAQQAIDSLNVSTAMTTVMAQYGDGAQVGLIEALKRDGSGIPADLPKNLADAVFEKTIGKATMVRSTDGYVVAHLTAINEVNSSNTDPSAVDKIQFELTQAMRFDIFEQLARSLEQRTTFNVNENTLRQAF